MTAVRSWDAFSASEAEIRGMVVDPRWRELPVPAQAQVIAARVLVTPDGDRWLFGAHARWYLHDPADGRWHPAPPPRSSSVRQVSHPAAVLPARLIPRGPDFAAEPGSTQAFIGPDVPEALTEQVRVLLRASGRKSELEFPLTAFDEIFASDVPSTVAAIWGAVMWCSYAPAFDGNERLITIFGEYLRRPLPGDEWVRWLPQPSLLDLVVPVAERARNGRARAALRLLALLADTARILLADARFRPRALALITMIEPALRAQGLDDDAARVDDETVRQAWLSRCPPRFGRALLAETDPADNFRHSVYDLLEAVAFTPDPYAAAAGFLADLSDSKERLPRMLCHRLREAYRELDQAGLTRTSAAERTQPDGFQIPQTGEYVVPQEWTGSGSFPALPAPLPATVTGGQAVPEGGDEGGPDRASAAAVLGAAYATGLAWQRLTGARVPAKGFAGSQGLVQRLIRERDDSHP